MKRLTIILTLLAACWFPATAAATHTPPTNLGATPTSAGVALFFDHTPGAGDHNSHRIYRNTNGGPFTLLAILPNGHTYFHGTAVPEAEHQYYATNTIEASGVVVSESGPSNIVRATRDTMPAEPGIRGAFYYPWFPETTFGLYNPTLPTYNSSESADIDQHVNALEHGKFEIGIASWWGRSGVSPCNVHSESTRVPLLLDRTEAQDSDLKWALYYEQEGFDTTSCGGGTTDPTPATIAADLTYIYDNYVYKEAYYRDAGTAQPVIFVYNANDDDGATCDVVNRWNTANASLPAHKQFRIVFKVFANGITNCTTAADWHQYGNGGADKKDEHDGHSLMISPGFNSATNTAAFQPRGITDFRNNVNLWETDGADDKYHLVVSFNELGEGTQVEEMREWASASGYGDYLDILNENGDSNDPIIETAGDIVREGLPSASNPYDQTADLLTALGPTGVQTLGDNQYEQGTLTQFQTWYDPEWGKHKSVTKPAVGNHEYTDPAGNAQGYFDYFGAAAGTVGQGYYSYDIGNWHVIVLNSACGDGGPSCSAGSAQDTWLANDLATVPTSKCIATAWHHPRYSSGASHYTGANGASSSGPRTQQFWTRLLAAGADVSLVGHAHIYERLAPQDNSGNASSTGIREFVVGTGGKDMHALGTAFPNTEERQTGQNGLLKLRLKPNGYDWNFVPVDQDTYTDEGTDTCNN